MQLANEFQRTLTDVVNAGEEIGRDFHGDVSEDKVEGVGERRKRQKR